MDARPSRHRKERRHQNDPLRQDEEALLVRPSTWRKSPHGRSSRQNGYGKGDNLCRTIDRGLSCFPPRVDRRAGAYSVIHGYQCRAVSGGSASVIPPSQCPFALSVDVIVAECVSFESVSCPNLLNMWTGTTVLSQIALNRAPN